MQKTRQQQEKNLQRIIQAESKEGIAYYETAH